MFCFKCYLRDFRDDSMVKTLPSNVWDANSIPGQETKIPHATWPKDIKNKRVLMRMWSKIVQLLWTIVG